jgi:hypothetical protein
VTARPRTSRAHGAGPFRETVTVIGLRWIPLMQAAATHQDLGLLVGTELLVGSGRLRAAALPGELPAP